MEKKCAISSIIYWLLVPLLVNFIVFILPHFVTFVSFMTILCWGTTYGQRCDIRLWIYDEKYFQNCSDLLKSVLKWMSLYKWPFYDHSWPFFGHVCIYLSQTEVLTVILRCLTGLNLDWVKSYGLRCSLRPHASSANSKKIATDK